MGVTRVTVTVTSEKTFEPEYELFYALDLDRLKELSDKIRKGADQITDFSLENGSMRCTVTAHEGEKLFLILPRTVGWQTTLNGQNIETEEFAHCLTVIPSSREKTGSKECIERLTYAGASLYLWQEFCCWRHMKLLVVDGLKVNPLEKQ